MNRIIRRAASDPSQATLDPDRVSGQSYLPPGHSSGYDYRAFTQSASDSEIETLPLFVPSETLLFTHNPEAFENGIRRPVHRYDSCQCDFVLHFSPLNRQALSALAILSDVPIRPHPRSFGSKQQSQPTLLHCRPHVVIALHGE